MKLFDETENKYYELIAYLLLEQDGFSSEKLQKLLSQYMDEEIDFEHTSSLLLSLLNSFSVVITDEDGYEWYNKEYSNAAEIAEILAKSISALFGFCPSFDATS